MEARDFYRQVSAAYNAETFEPEARTLSGLGRKLRTLKVLDLLDRHLVRPGRVVDVGCGPAQYAEPLLERGHEYVGVDISPEMFAETAQRLAGNPRARFQVGNAEHLDLPDGEADGVLCVGVIEYLPAEAAALAEIRRVLRPGGVAIVTFPSTRHLVSRFKAALRPWLAPALRRAVPSLRDRVWVSDITHRTIDPDAFLAGAQRASLRVVETVSNGFYPLQFNHRLSAPELALFLKAEEAGERLVPGAGTNFIACLAT